MLSSDAAFQPRSVPVAELPVATPQEEARTAIALVKRLLGHGVACRDIALVTRTADAYEQYLHQAAKRHGISITVWTQLPLATTVSYRLCTGICTLLDQDTTQVSPTDLLTPLVAGWSPPETPRVGQWPVPSSVIQQWTYLFPDDERSLEGWTDVAEEIIDDRRLQRYLQWLLEQPVSPAPDQVATLVDDLLTTYSDVALPVVMAEDNPAKHQTIRQSRSVVRLQELTGKLQHMYQEQCELTASNRQWKTVSEILHRLARKAPGRREHANARAIDVIEGNDLWERSYEYLVVMGLTDDHWPQSRSHILPAEIRQASLTSHDGLESVVPQMTWDQYQERDMFIETIQAATTAAVITYHRTDEQGRSREKSPLLDVLQTLTLRPSVASQLQDPDMPLPDELYSITDVGDSNND